MDQALALTPNDPEMIYAAFRLRVYAGRIDQAAQLAPAVLATRPGDGFANLVLAVEAIKKGDYRGAERQLGRIGAENQLGALREYVMAWLKAGEKDFAAARSYLARLKPAAGERAEAPALVIAAQIDELAGDKAAAEAKYRHAMTLDRNGLRTTIAVAEGLRRLGKDADARELLKNYAEKYSDAVVVDALIASNAPMPKPPSPAAGIAEILFDIGGILAADQRNQRTDLALIFYQLATALKPEQDFAWLMISGLYEQFRQTPKAVAALGKIGPNSPLYWQARLRTAALDAQEDKLDQAVFPFRTARKKTVVGAAAPFGSVREKPPHAPVYGGDLDRRIGLRMTSAISEKREKWRKWSQAGLVSAEDAFVIALSGSMIDLADFDFHEPRIARLLLGFGGSIYRVAPGSDEVTRELEPRSTLTKSNGATVTSALFENDKASEVTAVLFSAVHAKQLDLTIEREQRYGEWFARVALSNERRNLIFDFADMFPDLRGWQLAAVSGLPAS